MAFSWCQDKLDWICRVSAHKKSEFFECLKRRFSWCQNNCDVVSGPLDSWKRQFSVYEIIRFLMALKETWRNCLFWQPEDANFPNPKKIPFSWHPNDIDGTSSVLASWKIQFSESDTYRFVGATKEHEAISVLPPQENQIFWIRNKSPFHGT